MIKRKICIYFIFGFLALVVGFTLIHIYSEDSIFETTEIDEINLNNHQMQKDFDFLYNTLESNVPMLNDYADLYGIDYGEIKTRYSKLINSAKSDFEFYCILYSFVQEIPSCHTTLCFPNGNLYDNSAINGSCITDKTLLYAYYWYNEIKNKIDSMPDGNMYWFNYVDGEYYNFKPSCIKCDNDYIDANIKLCKINGVDVLNYLKSTPSGHRLDYDFKNNVSYRNKIILNEAGIGEKVIVTFNYNDKYWDYEMYMGIESDILYGFKYLYEDPPSDLSCVNNDFYFYRDDLLNVEYIYVKNFSVESAAIAISEEIKSIPQNYKIIFDLRGNSGGYLTFAEKIIFPLLTNKSIISERTWYAYKNNHYINDESKAQYSDIYNSYKRVLEYKGKSQKNYQIFLLTGSTTASAADEFVAVMKDNNLAQVIGENTMGEGLASTYCAEVLPNSNLVFYFMPGKAYNQDGTDNSTYGTAPMVYVNQNENSFRLYENLILDNEDPNTYENRLKWDNVLIETLKIIKEKENAE